MFCSVTQQALIFGTPKNAFFLFQSLLFTFPILDTRILVLLRHAQGTPPWFLWAGELWLKTSLLVQPKLSFIQNRLLFFLHKLACSCLSPVFFFYPNMLIYLLSCGEVALVQHNSLERCSAFPVLWAECVVERGAVLFFRVSWTCGLSKF